MQSVTDSKVYRTFHVWRKLSARQGGGWRCVLCGGVSHHPTDDCTPVRFDRLEDEDRRLCPPEKGLPAILEGKLADAEQGNKGIKGGAKKGGKGTDLGFEVLDK